MVKLESKYLYLIGLIILVWIAKTYIFVNDQDLIKRTLNRVADQASFEKKTIHPFEQIRQAKELAQNFTPKIEIVIKSPHGKKQKMYTHEQLIKYATLARSYLDALDIRFKDQKIKITGDSAEVNLTAVAQILEKSGQETEEFAQELVLKLKKNGTEWYLENVENVEFLQK